MSVFYFVPKTNIETVKMYLEFGGARLKFGSSISVIQYDPLHSQFYPAPELHQFWGDGASE